MTIKYTLQGALIYFTLLFFTATLAAAIATRKSPKPSPLPNGFWLAGFAAAVLSLIWRGISSGHPPMQNLFEFFLCMAAALWPLSLWNKKVHNLPTLVQDSAIGILILIPAGFVFSEELRRLPPALQSPLFVPHVAAYVAGYVMMARAAVMALPFFKSAPNPQRAAAVHQSVAVGFLLVTIGLLLGSVWGKICWGHYWQWDPKEMWSLATWFVYAAYFHLAYWHGSKHPRVSASLLWLGVLFIILTLTWINLSRIFAGMHTYA